MNENFNVVLSRMAQEDLVNGILWYENRRSGLGLEFEQELNQKLLEIGENPFIRQKVFKEARTAYLRRFPYSIQYIVDQSATRVYVFRIVPQAFDPQNWQDSYPE